MAKETRTVKGRNGGTLKPIPPGETRNPAGRPKSAKFLTELLKTEMDSDAEITIEGIALNNATAGQVVKIKIKMPTHRNIVQALLRKASKGDTKAIEMIFDRTEGKVPLQLSGDPDQPLVPAPQMNLTSAAIEKLIDKL